MTLLISLREEKSQVLDVFHALTGCDQTTSFLGHDKRTAWSTWDAHNNVTAALLELSKAPCDDDLTNIMESMKRFVVLHA